MMNVNKGACTENTTYREGRPCGRATLLAIFGLTFLKTAFQSNVKRITCLPPVFVFATIANITVLMFSKYHELLLVNDY